MRNNIIIKLLLLAFILFGIEAANSQICTTVCKANTAKKYYVSGFDATSGNVTSVLWQVNPLSQAVIVGASNQDTVEINFTNVPVGAVVKLTCTASNNCGNTPVFIDVTVTQCAINIPDTALQIPIGPTSIPIGPSIVPIADETIDVRIEGPFHNSGTASVDPMTGLVTLIPNDTLFVGQDTIRRIVCKTPGTCDTSLIIVNNPAPVVVLRDTTPVNTATNFPSLIPIIFEGTPLAPVVDPRLTINPDGTVTYTPLPNFVGIDTAYIVRCDNAVPQNCVTTTYIVTVTPDVKSTDTATPMNTPIKIGSPLVLGPNSSQELQGPNHGTRTINPDGTITYTPIPKYVGIDTIRQIVCVNGICDTAIHLIQVNPSLNDTALTIPLNTPKTIAGPGLIPGPGTSIAYTAAGGPSNGTAMIDPLTGAVTYTPRTNFIGIDTVKLSVCVTYPDNSFKCDTAYYIFKIVPTSNDDTVVTKEDTPISGGDPISRVPGTSVSVSTTGPNNGSAIVNSDGTVTYTPSKGFVGIDTVVRIVCTYDSATMIRLCDTSFVIFKVLPVSKNDTITTSEDTPISGGKPIPRVLGTSVTVSITGPNNGSAIVNSDGTVTYTPSKGFVGKDTVVRVVCIYDSATMIRFCDTSLIIFTVNSNDILIPNYFSPNGDGSNDVWNLDVLLSKYPNAKALIYNRWGNIVWRSTGAYGKSTSGSNIWYGQLEGSQDPVPDGVYYYLLELEDKFQTTKAGFIEVMRQ